MATILDNENGKLEGDILYTTIRFSEFFGIKNELLWRRKENE